MLQQLQFSRDLRDLLVIANNARVFLWNKGIPVRISGSVFHQLYKKILVRHWDSRRLG
ncbi:hypothetical protein KIN20_016956 [Parelaphostrongylus tenuis]|uniref:Uncharacterized protein n=1 Tax=Parelaphostrongylus tenuis TaxID=148309 RepID=A0AAD5QNB7_PARTN|nr:hypothetical protein KIN20_016956 [Parelaphostrongylus tenuis]